MTKPVTCDFGSLQSVGEQLELRGVKQLALGPTVGGSPGGTQSQIAYLANCSYSHAGRVLHTGCFGQGTMWAHCVGPILVRWGNPKGLPGEVR